MGTLTEAMTRLSGEIGAMRRARKALLEEVARATTNRKAAVTQERANFANAHANMARRTKADRMNFLYNLKRAVDGQRKEFRADLAGAHRAWFSTGARRAAQ